MMFYLRYRRYLLNDSIDLTLRLCMRMDTILRTQQGFNNGPFFLLDPLTGHGTREQHGRYPRRIPPTTTGTGTGTAVPVPS